MVSCYNQVAHQILLIQCLHGIIHVDLVQSIHFHHHAPIDVDLLILFYNYASAPNNIAAQKASIGMYGCAVYFLIILGATKNECTRVQNPHRYTYA